MQCTIINIFKKRSVSIDPSPSVLLKMMTILYDPLVWMSKSFTEADSDYMYSAV